MFGMGPWELLVIFVVVLLLFGAKRLPEIAQGLGKGIREFKKNVKDTTDDLKGSLDEPDEKPKKVDTPTKKDGGSDPQ